MRKSFLVLITTLLIYHAKAQIYLPAGVAGQWTFDNPADLVHADVGNDLILSGTHTSIAGPETGDSAVRIPLGSFYHCRHNIPANGSGSPSRVNNYSILMDFRVNSLGQWYSFYQTTIANNNDADFFISTSGNIGVSAVGYSSFSVSPGQWYRMVISASMGNHYDCYIDGHLILSGTYQAVDGRFSLDPQGGNNDVLLFADDNGEDNIIDIAQIVIFDHDLTSSQIDSMGGFTHPAAEINPYLQLPTPVSMMVNWHSSETGPTVVQYGVSPANLNITATGSYEDLGGKLWHTVRLTGLQPSTTYYYQCRSGADTSKVYPFHTPPPVSSQPQGHIRFVILGDTRTDISRTTAIADSIRHKCKELYGNEWYKEINFVMHVGDIVTYGGALSMYQDEYFTPYSTLSSSIPFMVSIGNHEMDYPTYFQYLKYAELYDGTYPDSTMCSKYYSFQLGNCKFISINSNSPYTDASQTGWLSNVLNLAESNPTLDFVFAYAHHPGHTEIWPDGNCAYMQISAIPTLANYPKHVMFSYGHSHDYERGAFLSTHNMGWDSRLMLSGGGGAPLDRWRMYTNQTEYPEIHRSFDYYCFQIVDVDMDNKSYTAYNYTMGHTDRPTPMTLLDQWHFRKLQPPPQKPLAMNPAMQYSEGDTLHATPISGYDSLMTSEFQIVRYAGNFSLPLHDTLRDYENIYMDSAVSFIPINRNAGIDLTSLVLPAGWLTSGETYKWRMRYRDMNMKWSPWSDSAVFTAVGIYENISKKNILNIYPNPFTNELNISFRLSKPGKVSIRLYNVKGELISTLTEKFFEAGENLFVWRRSQDHIGQMPSGTYIIRLLGTDLDLKERAVLKN